MKKKEDDLAKVDGVAIPTWAKVLAFVVSFISVIVIYFLIRYFLG